MERFDLRHERGGTKQRVAQFPCSQRDRVGLAGEYGGLARGVQIFLQPGDLGGGFVDRRVEFAGGGGALGGHCFGLIRCSVGGCARFFFSGKQLVERGNPAFKCGVFRCRCFSRGVGGAQRSKGFFAGSKFGGQLGGPVGSLVFHRRDAVLSGAKVGFLRLQFRRQVGEAGAEGAVFPLQSAGDRGGA